MLKNTKIKLTQTFPNLQYIEELSGLQLTNILLFDKAFKLSLLWRICSQTESWAFFHTIIILIQQFYGSTYIENIEQNINLKCFWIDVVQAIKLLWERFYPTNHTKCKWLDTPLC